MDFHSVVDSILGGGLRVFACRVSAVQKHATNCYKNLLISAKINQVIYMIAAWETKKEKLTFIFLCVCFFENPQRVVLPKILRQGIP